MDKPKPKPPLHNFDMPPPCLRWGCRRILQCSKVPSAAARFSGHRRFLAGELSRAEKAILGNFQLQPLAAPGGCRRRSDGGGDDGGIEAVREKLMLDLQKETDRIRAALLGKGCEKAPAPSPALLSQVDPPAAEKIEKRWNLRERREKVKIVGGRKADSLPARIEAPVSGKRRRGPELSVTLSRGEIEEDFMEMVGHRPPRRPKKRPKDVQKELDCLFPGLWLRKITPDLYKVDGDSETQKR